MLGFVDDGEVPMETGTRISVFELRKFSHKLFINWHDEVFFLKQIKL